MARPPFAERAVFWGSVFVGITTFEEESIVFCVVVSGDVATRLFPLPTQLLRLCLYDCRSSAVSKPGVVGGDTRS